MFKFCDYEGHVADVALFDVFPECDDFASEFSGGGDGEVDSADHFLFGFSLGHAGEVDGVRFDGLDEVEQELAVVDGFVFEVFDSELLWYSGVGPGD